MKKLAKLRPRRCGSVQFSFAADARVDPSAMVEAAPTDNYLMCARLARPGMGNFDSPAINRAIDSAVAVGGGRCSCRRNLSVRLDSSAEQHPSADCAGATILGAPQSMNVYDETEPYTLGGYQDGGIAIFTTA